MIAEFGRDRNRRQRRDSQRGVMAEAVYAREVNWHEDTRKVLDNSVGQLWVDTTSLDTRVECLQSS